MDQHESSRSRTVYRLAALVAVMAFLAVGAALSFRHHDGVVFPDEQEYDALAGNLVKYHMLTWDGLAPTASRPPGFVFWLAIWKSLGIGWSGLAWINFLIVAIGLWIFTGVWFSPERLGPGRTVVFGLLFLYPVSLYVFSTLYPQAFCLALLLISLTLMLGNTTWLRAMAAGFLMGWCTLAAPIYLTWAGVVALSAIFERKLTALSHAAVFSLAFLLVVGGWGARNTLVMGKFVPFSTNSGFNLLIGNCENTRPNAGLNIDVSRYVAAVDSQKLNETRTDAFYSAAAKEWILKNPGAAISMYFQKLLNYFNFRNELVTVSAGSPLRDAAMFVTYYGLLACLLIRLAGVRGENAPTWRDWLLVAGYLACAMFTSIATTRIRYRIPCDVMLFPIIAPLVFEMGKSIAGRLRPR